LTTFYILKRKETFFFIILVISLLIGGCGGSGGTGGSGGSGGGSPGGTIRLAWDPPTTNVDGSPLTDLAGYKIYYGTASGTYGQPIDVGNVTTYTLTGLVQGQTYYIAATAYDTSNNQSGFSNEVSGVAQ
jgi:hypothetical protein